MKKIFIFLGILLFLSGCGKYSEKDLVSDLTKKIENLKAYHLTGTLEIYRNEDKYTYDVASSFKEGDYFKVDLINQNNNHKQIILKNKEGVYVLTPSLNKSFKFQSDWPYNNSQIYLLQPILNDITSDNNKNIEKTSDGYIITTKVNYSTESDFNKQKIYVDLKNNITKIEVLDSNDSIKMALTIIDIDYNKQFEDDYFDISKYNIEENKEEKENSNNKESLSEENEDTLTSKIEEIVYPMYVPTDTYLTGQDIVETNSGERVILTFNGESTFTIVQENLSDMDNVNYIYGDPYLILDTVGAITDYSVSWISNGIEYSVMSDSMNIDELLTVAQSISVKPVGK